MKIKLTGQITSQVQVIGIFQEENPTQKIIEVENFLTTYKDWGKLYETQLLLTKTGQVLLVGLGKKEKLDYQKLQNWAGVGVKTFLSKQKSIDITLPEIKEWDKDKIVEALVIGIDIAEFDPSRLYKSESKPTLLKEVNIISDFSNISDQTLNKAQIISSSINLARSLGDMPSNEMTPTFFVNKAEQVFRGSKVKVTVINESQADKLGLGVFSAVARGSEESSYILVLEYRGDPKSKDIWGLVGKGITFDTGGISIKPSSSMHEMKYDMCGAGSVLGAMIAISKLKLKQNVVAIMPLTENLLTGKALKPGDILKGLNGKTIEVLNTDAEGRLVLFDALALAQRKYQANKLIDLATLTGAIIVALGDFHTGVFGNNPEFTQKLIKSGSEVGERFWEMPMDEDFNEMVESEIADYTNLGHGGSMGERTAGAITGAKLIEMAIEKNNSWIHLDIAGTAWDLGKKPYRSSGATGVAVKTLVNLLSK